MSDRDDFTHHREIAPRPGLADGNRAADLAYRATWRLWWPIRLLSVIACATAKSAADTHREVLTPSGKDS